MKLTAFLKRNWLALTLAVLPFFIIIALWDRFPEEIPMHWNAKGEIDGYGSPASLFLTPIITLFTMAIVWLVPLLDPKKNVQHFQKTLDMIVLALAAFFLLVFIGIISASLGYEFDMGNVILSGVLILFIVLGNYFGKLRPNYFVGIRTPWTLENETVWLKTHRLGGKVWVYGSLIMLIAKFLLPMEPFFIFIFIGFTLIIALIPIVYSYLLYKKMEKEGQINP
ncbi:MAG: SdpI family protein [Bacteroidetes bacterium]|nr:SdpI family protein [Bacteroidota bacterium]